jgi:hypothetical protein
MDSCARKPPNRLPAAALRELACKASCDPRTAAKMLRGERVAAMPYARLVRALGELGYIVDSPDGDRE